MRMLLVLLALSSWLALSPLQMAAHPEEAAIHHKRNEWAQEGLIFLDQGNFSGAQNVFRKLLEAIEEDSAQEAAILGREIGTMFSDRGRFKQAYFFHRKFAQALPKTADTAWAALTLLGLGDQYLQARLPLEAVWFYQRVGDWAGPDFASRAVMKTALVHRQIGHPWMAIATCRRFVKPHPTDAARVRMVLADLLASLGQNRKARPIYQAIIKDNPLGPFTDDAMLGLAKLMQSCGKSKEAKNLVSMLLKDHPSSDRLREAKALLQSLSQGADR